MSRTLCPKCNKPLNACICQFVSNIDNKVKVVVLQHTSEVKQSKATVPLLANTLSNCQVFIGEDFNTHTELNTLITKYGQQCFLVYPSDNAIEITNKITAVQKYADICLILLDGTWKKTYLMYMLSKNLHVLPTLVLPEGIHSLYEIRSTKKDNALSTLEACYHCLITLESNEVKYRPLIDNFIKFNQFQLSFMPKEHFK